MIRFVVIDLESTDREPENAHIVEWAAVVTEPEWFGAGGMLPIVHGSLVKPPVPIPAETSAVHHIIDSDVLDSPAWDTEQRRVAELLDDPETIAVAHNAKYERTLLAPLNLKCRWLCTYKAALRVWPDAPGHSNETLRYWLGHGTGRRGDQRPHSARHDAEVTALLLRELLRNADPQDMIKWAEEPALLPRCPLGDWRGHPWSEVDWGFLDWILRKIHDREDVRFCAQMEIERREKAEREARQAQAAATSDAEEDSDIPF
jgi:exodeoxyribonuclease X